MTDEMKKLMRKIFYRLDNHFPDDALDNEYYNYFFDEYLKPIIEENNRTIKKRGSIE